MLPFFAGIISSLLWFSRELFSGYLFCFMDITRYFYPYRLFWVSSLKKGFIALWNPYIYMGMPFFATLQTGMFYPLSVLYFLPSFDYGFNLFIIFHFVLGFVLMYLMCRDLNLSIPASFIGGFSFAYSGYLNSVIHMITSVSSVIWLPLAVIFFRRLLDALDENSQTNKIASNGIFLSFSFLMMFLGGEPFVLYATILFFFGYIFVDFIFYNRDVKKIFSRILSYLISLFLFFALGAFQIIPFLELFFHSVRVGGLSFAEASYWSFPPHKIVSMVIPYFYNPSYMPFLNTDWLKTPYLGNVALFLAVFSAFFFGKKRIQIVFIGFLVSLLLAMGKYAFLYGLFYKMVPLFSLSRYPVKFLFMSTFLFSVVAALGFDELVKNIDLEKTRKILRGMFLFSFAIVLFSGILFVFKGFAANIFYPLFIFDNKGITEKFLYYMAHKNTVNIFILGVFFAAASVIPYLFMKKKISLKVFSFVFVLIVFLDVYASNKDVVSSMKFSDYHKSSKNIEILSKDKSLYRVYSAPPIANRNQYETASEWLNYPKALQSIRDRIPANQNMIYGISILEAYESIRLKDQDAILSRIRDLNTLDGIKILDFLNVKYLVSPYPFSQKGYLLKNKVFENVRGGEIYLYENKNVLPRAFVAARARKMDKDRALEYIFSGGFDPKKEVVLEKEAPDFHGVFLDVDLEKYLPNEVLLKAKGPGWLVLSDSYFPGWKVFVDGKEEHIYRANYMFRGVPLDKGSHVVRFIYDPVSFKLGILISMISFVFSLIALFVAIRRQNA